MNDLTQSRPGAPGQIPDPRDAPSEESPFSMAEPSEGYGMEPSSPFGGGGASVFESAPSPFAAAPADAPSPAPAGDAGAVPALEAEPAPPESPPVEPAMPEVAEDAGSKPEWPSPPEPAEKPAPVATTSPAPAAPVAATVATSAAASSIGETRQIRQLELRAIFGVDRELSRDEILQRLQDLAGIRRVSLIGPEELAALDTLRHALAGMASESTPLKLSFGSAPVDFIREGNAVLAVMTDGSFAPGVRETIIIAARELDRMA